MIIPWSKFKEFVDSRSISIQWLDIDDNYYLKAFDGYFSLDCNLIKSRNLEEVADFETNYKSDGNKSLTPVLTSVTTLFEKNDKDLKLCSAEAAVGEDSIATIEFKTPGVMANGEGRWIASGMAWFDTKNPHDRIIEINIIDKDNVLGYGANTVIKTYHDDEIDSAQAGYRVPPIGHVDVETLAGYGFLPAELYLQIKGKKGGDITTGFFFVNLEWGKTG